MRTLPALVAAAITTSLAVLHADQPLNLVLITADDLNWDSLGCNGCGIEGITPHLDRLAAEGMLLREAHATVPVCQPVRATMSTGLYPFHSGCCGFEPIRTDVTTLNEVLHQSGYLISMLGKNPHYQPHAKWCIDYEVLARDLSVGRSPQRFAEHTRKFLQLAKQQGRPFFHHVNCQDPHRPFQWSGEKSREGNFPPASRLIRPEEVSIPGFLENLPAVRQEVADYFTCVHRLDECVGAVLEELKAAGHEKDTLVMFFGGDHGMAFPFGKANVYANSSKAALILRWPEVIPAGRIDERHLVSTIDLAPTLLEAAALPALPRIDGRSFLSIAKGGEQQDRDHVVTMFHRTSGGKHLEMRCIRTSERAYIWNAWSDGKATYQAENMSGKSWAAMLEAAATDPAMRQRCDFYLKRVPEEFYVDEPCERSNRIADPPLAREIEAMRDQLEAWMVAQQDPLLESFRSMRKTR